MTTAFVVPPDFYITPSAAARLLNIPVREIDQLQADGRLQDVVTTPGNHRRYNMREVMSLVAERSDDPDAEGQQVPGQGDSMPVTAPVPARAES